MNEIKGQKIIITDYARDRLTVSPGNIDYRLCALSNTTNPFIFEIKNFQGEYSCVDLTLDDAEKLKDYLEEKINYLKKHYK